MTDLEKIDNMIQRFEDGDPTAEAAARSLMMGMLANADKKEIRAFLHGFRIVIPMNDIKRVK